MMHGVPGGNWKPGKLRLVFGWAWFFLPIGLVIGFGLAMRACVA